MPFAAAAAAVAAGGAIASGVMQSDAAGDAADSMANAARQATLQDQFYTDLANKAADARYKDQKDFLYSALDQSRNDLSPYSLAGSNALMQLTGGLSPARAYQAPMSSQEQLARKNALSGYSKHYNTVSKELEKVNELVNSLSTNTPSSYKKGMTTDPIWESILSGYIMNRPWSTDKDAQEAYANVLGQYNEKVKGLKDRQKRLQEQFNSAKTHLQSYGDQYTRSLGNKATGEGDLLKSFTMDDYKADPGFDFRVREGTKAINNSAAGQGGLLSGATLKALQRYGQEMGSQEYGNAYNRFNIDKTNKFNRLLSLVGVGQNASMARAGYSQNTGANLSNAAGNNAQLISNNFIGQGQRTAENTMQAGNAQASGIIGQGNAMSGIASSIGNIASNYLGGLGAQQYAGNYNPNYSAYNNAITPKFSSGSY